DSRGLWRQTRATVRLWTGDLAGAAEDNPLYAIPVRDPRATARQIDLTAHYNELLVPDGRGAFGCDLAALPRGLNTLEGTLFDLRGIIQLSGAAPDPRASTFPREVKDVPISQQ